jgi:uncharacterized protein involved in exopolysaccharide biosynthesis
MTRLLLFVVFLWRHRWQLLMPAFILPLLGLAWSLSQPPVYTAHATLQLNAEATRSPFLSHLTAPDQQKQLLRLLTSPDVLEQTSMETGVVLSPQNLSLRPLSNQLIQIIYRSEERPGLEEVLDTLIFNFIHELLSPERLRTEQQLMALEAQIQTYKKNLGTVEGALNALKRQPIPSSKEARQSYQQNLTTLEFQEERLTTQLKLSRQEYETLLVSMQLLQPQALAHTAAGMLWFAEPTVVENGVQRLEEHLQTAWRFFYVGLFLGVGILLLRVLTDTSLRRDERITATTALPILSRIPPLGRVHVLQKQIPEKRESA